MTLLKLKLSESFSNKSMNKCLKSLRRIFPWKFFCNISFNFLLYFYELGEAVCIGNAKITLTTPKHHEKVPINYCKSFIPLKTKDVQNVISWVFTVDKNSHQSKEILQHLKWIMQKVCSIFSINIYHWKVK